MSAVAPEGHEFGLWHPSWSAAQCFYFDTAEEAQASIVKVYGPAAAHVVIERIQRVVVPEQAAK